MRNEKFAGVIKPGERTGLRQNSQLLGPFWQAVLTALVLTVRELLRLRLRPASGLVQPRSVGTMSSAGPLSCRRVSRAGSHSDCVSTPAMWRAQRR